MNTLFIIISILWIIGTFLFAGLGFMAGGGLPTFYSILTYALPAIVLLTLFLFRKSGYGIQWWHIILALIISIIIIPFLGSQNSKVAKDTKYIESSYMCGSTPLKVTFAYSEVPPPTGGYTYQFVFDYGGSMYYTTDMNHNIIHKEEIELVQGMIVEPWPGNQSFWPTVASIYGNDYNKNGKAFAECFLSHKAEIIAKIQLEQPYFAQKWSKGIFFTSLREHENIDKVFEYRSGKR